MSNAPRPSAGLGLSNGLGLSTGLGLAGGILGAGTILVPPLVSGLAGQAAPVIWLVHVAIGAAVSIVVG
ncbi:MAG: hypothetical protein ACRDN0_18225, partial [Trebonia sp.]